MRSFAINVDFTNDIDFQPNFYFEGASFLPVDGDKRHRKLSLVSYKFKLMTIDSVKATN